MKRLFSAYALLLTALVAVATACEDDEGSYDLYHATSIKIVSTDLDLRAMADTAVVVIGSEGQVSARTASSWLTTEVKGSTVYAYALQNNDLYSRAARLVILQGGDSAVVTVQQRGINFVSADEGVISFSADEQTASVYVQHSVDVVFGDVPQWITTGQTADSIFVSVAYNNTGYARSAYVTYSVGELSDSLLVSQASDAAVSIESHELTIEEAASEQHLAFEANYDLELTDVPDWLTVSVAADELVLESTKNETGDYRQAYVSFHVGDAKDSVLVIQKGGIVIELEKTALVLTEEASENHIKLEHNFDITIGDLPDWITVDVSDDEVVISVAENATGTYRDAVITLTSAAGAKSLTKEVSVLQYTLLGAYTLYYYSADEQTEDNLESLPVQLVYLEKQFYLYNPTYKYLMPVDYDAETLTFSWIDWEQVGSLVYNGSTLTLVDVFGTESKLGIDATYTATFSFKDGVQTATFESDDAKNIIIAAFDEEFAYVGAVEIFYHPYLEKTPAE